MENGVGVYDVQRMKKINQMIGIGKMLIVRDAERVRCKRTADSHCDRIRGGALGDL